MNEAFKKLFICTDTVLGRDITQIIDAEYFENFACSKNRIIRLEREYKQYSKFFHIILYRIDSSDDIVAIFVDMTDSIDNRRKLNNIKKESVIKARELLEHQIKISQDLAEFLGESTAKSEKIIDDLIGSIER